MSKLPPVGSPEREYVVTRLMQDTGFYCRYVLGMDTDRDESGNCTTEIGKGGVRDHGPHQQVIQFLDEPAVEGNRHRILMAPRYSYKSSMVRGFIQRNIIAHPNISILLVMHDWPSAMKRCNEIREDLETNPILRELFPNMKSDRLWRQHEFITGLRTDTASDTPTLYIASPKKSVTGSRPNIVIFDDIVTEMDLSDLALQKSRTTVERALLLGARGCLYVDVGTPYHYADAHHWILDQRGWKKLVNLDVGFDIQVNDDKSLSLTGKGLWPNLSKQFIEEKLHGGLSFPTFMSQYKLQVVSGTHEAFIRTQFHPVAWKEEFSDLTGYLLTDTAQGTPEGGTSSEQGRGCLNVLMYIGIDARNHVYILDLQVGRWKMFDFCQRYLDMLDRWSSKVNHRVELWEQVHSNYGYASFLGLKGKERNRATRIAWQKRGHGPVSKQARIRNTSGRFQAGEVHVVNTVPRTWVDDADNKVLWDPEGYLDVEKNVRLPGGDLVEQFIRFPYHSLRDIPDAFSLVDSVDEKTQNRVCYHVKPSRLKIPESDKRDFVIGSRVRGSSSGFFDRLRKRRHA